MNSSRFKFSIAISNISIIIISSIFIIIFLVFYTAGRQPLPKILSHAHRVIAESLWKALCELLQVSLKSGELVITIEERAGRLLAAMT